MNLIKITFAVLTLAVLGACAPTFAMDHGHDTKHSDAPCAPGDGKKEPEVKDKAAGAQVAEDAPLHHDGFIVHVQPELEHVLQPPVEPLSNAPSQEHLLEPMLKRFYAPETVAVQHPLKAAKLSHARPTHHTTLAARLAAFKRNQKDLSGFVRLLESSDDPVGIVKDYMVTLDPKQKDELEAVQLCTDCEYFCLDEPKDAESKKTYVKNKQQLLQLMRVLYRLGIQGYSKVEGNPRIMSSLESDKTDVLETLLDCGADINARARKTNETALCTAVRQNKPDFVRVLLDRKAHVIGQDLLSAACLSKEKINEEIIKMLLDAGARFEGPVSNEVISTLNELLVRALHIIENSTNPHEIAFWKTLMRGIFMLGVTGAEADGWNMLMQAVQEESSLRGSHQIRTRILLEAGAPINAATTMHHAHPGVTPLMIAIAKRDPVMVDLLLQHKADVNKTDSRGYRPLVYALGFGDTIRQAWHLGIIKMLLDKGAIFACTSAPIDFNNKTVELLLHHICVQLSAPFLDRETEQTLVAMFEKIPHVSVEPKIFLKTFEKCPYALNRIFNLIRQNVRCEILMFALTHYAKEAGEYQQDWIAFIKDSNFNCKDEIRDRDGNTLLMRAVKANDIEVARLLLSMGCSPHLLTRDGKHAMELAIDTKNPAMIRLLHEHGVNINMRFGDDTTPLIKVVINDRDDLSKKVDISEALQLKMMYEAYRDIVISDSYDVAKELLRLKANTEIRDELGTALTHASSKGRFDMCRLLCHSKANVNPPGKISPLDAAKRSPYKYNIHNNVALFLRSKGAFCKDDLYVTEKQEAKQDNKALRSLFLEKKRTRIQITEECKGRTIVIVAHKEHTALTPFGKLVGVGAATALGALAYKYGWVSSPSDVAKLAAAGGVGVGIGYASVVAGKMGGHFGNTPGLLCASAALYGANKWIAPSLAEIVGPNYGRVATSASVLTSAALIARLYMNAHDGDE